MFFSMQKLTAAMIPDRKAVIQTASINQTNGWRIHSKFVRISCPNGEGKG
jgi:hypothetical protein